MANIAPGYVLKAGELARPVVWTSPPLGPIDHFPGCGDELMDKVMGGRAKAFRTYGHDAKGIHWLCTQKGVQMHNDLTYTRYTHHLVVRNDGWMLVGLDKDHRHPYLAPGTMLCLDTHSPHALVVDPRRSMAEPRLKLALVGDATRPLMPEEVWSYLAPRLLDLLATPNPGEEKGGPSKKVPPLA